jgi:prepilin-type N-terminal cleavage/methylation domain-containing protein
MKCSKSGFSLVEVLIVMFIAVMAFTSFYSVSTIGTRYIIDSKNRLAATALVNEKMEIIRNLAYEDVGTMGSTEVPGNIPQYQEMSANGRKYDVQTSVRYFDDPMDGVSPTDPIPNDFKIVKVEVSWNDSNGVAQNVSSVSRFVPPGFETSDGGSPLSISVNADDTMAPVPQAEIHITNDTLSPPIDDRILTDDQGHLVFPSARISNDDHLVITKLGYETVQTMDSTATFTPKYGHVNVIAGFLNTYNYFQNKLADLTVKTVDYQNNIVGNIEFTIGGGKVLGHDNFLNSVYSMPNETGTTDAISGERKYPDISPGNYSITMSDNVQYKFVDYEPSTFPVFLSPDADMIYTLRVADKSVPALFLQVKDSDVSHAPIADAKVTLSDGATDIFVDKLSSLRGVVFFPDDATVLENKDYTLKVAADGYSTETKSITINNLTEIEVDLTRI